MKAIERLWVIACVTLIAPMPLQAGTTYGADPYYDEQGNPVQNPELLYSGEPNSGAELPAADLLPDPGYMQGEDAPDLENEPLEPDADPTGSGE